MERHTMQDDMKRKEKERIEQQRISISNPSAAPGERVRNLFLRRNSQGSAIFNPHNQSQ
jgi:hypothetical protein